ncbi:MAG: hypothetical protein H6937_07830 [Burkholderiales bacterium]|nr:hypothetical protein [Burkholderiales bacterium]MDR4516980.1 hypothetical protein [Nitrosomonas sp.]
MNTKTENLNVPFSKPQAEATEKKLAPTTSVVELTMNEVTTISGGAGGLFFTSPLTMPKAFA